MQSLPPKGVNLIKMYDKEDSKAQQCFLVLIINMIISIEYCCILKIRGIIYIVPHNYFFYHRVKNIKKKSINY